MQARVKWVEGLTFLGESASGHQILMDGNSGDKAPSPMITETEGKTTYRHCERIT